MTARGAHLSADIARKIGHAARAVAADVFICKPRHLCPPTIRLVAEELGAVCAPLLRAPRLPFGHLQVGWLEFLAKQTLACSLWLFEVPGLRYCRFRGLDWAMDCIVHAELVFDWR
jgi:hypothetical protein